MDQPAFENRGRPSLNSRSRCLKIVDTFRAAVGLAAAARRRLPTIALSLVVAVALWGWASPHLDARAVWADLPDARVAGRHFVVGYTDVAEVRALSRAGLIGGVFLTRRNVEQRSAEAVAAEIGARRDAVPAKGDAAP